MTVRQNSPVLSFGNDAKSRPKLLQSIDVARGLAALGVTLYHANQWILWPGVGVEFFSGGLNAFSKLPLAYLFSYIVFGFGFLGVQLFFVLSGFCIHLPNANANAVDWRQFLVRRFFRIYPCYLLLVLLAFCAQALTGGAALGPAPWKNFAGHLIFWHYADGGASAGMGISPVLWTLTLEAHFYVLYVIIFPLLRKWGVGRVTIIWLLADLIYTAIYVNWFADLGWSGYWSPTRFSLLRFGEWLVGAYLAERYAQGIPRWRYALPGGIGLLIAAIASGAFFSLDRYTATNIPATVAFFLILQHYVGIERYECSIGKLSCWKQLSVIGAFSYSLYLFHALVIPVIRRAAVSLGDDGMKYFVFVLAVACSIVAACIVYAMVERPTHEWGRLMAAKFGERSRERIVA